MRVRVLSQTWLASDCHWETLVETMQGRRILLRFPHKVPAGDVVTVKGWK